MSYDISLLTTEAISLIHQLIEIPSPSGREKELADFLQQYLEVKGITSGRKGNNVWCLSPQFDLNKPTLLLSSHIDTAEPTNEWIKRPFMAKESNGKIYGLGSNDAGASLACLLQIFLLLSKKRQPYNLVFLASCKQDLISETSTACVIDELPPIHFAIIGEPTAMHPATAECGKLSMTVQIKNSINEQCATEKFNAVYKALTDWEWYHQSHFQKESALLGKIAINVTNIQTSHFLQGVPQVCTYQLEVRINEKYTPEEIIETIQQNIKGKIIGNATILKASLLEDAHPIMHRLLSLGFEPFGSSSCSEQAVFPYPSIKMGPGAVSRIGQPDEYIKIQEVEQGLETYLKFLDELEIPFTN